MPVVARHISVCRHDKRDAAVALAGKSGTTAPNVPGKERLWRSDYTRTGLVLLHGKAIGTFDLVALDISVGRRHQPFAGLTILAKAGYADSFIAGNDGVQWRPYQFTVAAVPEANPSRHRQPLPTITALAGISLD